MPFDPQAAELNETINSVNPHTFNLLSERGKSIYFPKKGILSQSADAQNCRINATIGTALEDDNIIMHLDSIAGSVSLDPGKVFPYAKGSGTPQLRKVWKEMMIEKNPSLGGVPLSLPIVTSALTHGLSVTGYVFISPGDTILVPDLYWGNYRLIFEKTWLAQISTYATFTPNGGYNCQGLRTKLFEKGPGKKIVILNFPNNPTGYSPTNDEAQNLVSILIEAAEAGNDILVICDDAYFGLVYEKNILTESLFSRLANAHDRITAVKIDGPTKEDYVWGFRIGFITLGTKQSSGQFYDALESKLAGAIRATLSNCSHLAQSLLLQAYESAAYASEKQTKFMKLKERYTVVCEILKKHPEYREAFEPLPFNSGYFMCVNLKEGIDAEKVRHYLIKNYDTGVIALGKVIRVAFSSTPTPLLETLFNNIYNACKEISR